MVIRLPTDDKRNKKKTKTGSEYQLSLGHTIRLVCLLLSAGGILLSIVLTDGHYDHVVGGRVTGCAITTYIDCDRVSSSDFATIVGIPISVFGFVFHLFLIGLLLPGFFRKLTNYGSMTMPLVILLTFTGALVSLALAFISLVIIKALCIYCTALQIVNLAIFIVVIVWIRERKPGKIETRRPSLRKMLIGLKNPPIIGPIVALVIALSGGFLLMYGMEKRDYGATSAISSSALINMYFSDTVHEFTTDDSPSLGSNELGFQIIVFSDYNCTHCKGVDEQLQRLVDDFNGRIELVFKFFPFDGDCNPFIENSQPSTSCEAAAAAFVAFEQGVFWEYHSTLFDNYRKYSRARLVQYAQDIGMDLELFKTRIDDDFVKRRLYLDILEGVVAGISYTPTVLLNGSRIESFRKEGDSRYELLKDTIQELIEQRASQG